MGLNVINGAQLYMHSKRQCDDSFLEKKMSFCFNHPRNPATESRNEKFRSLKYFEEHSIQEKEPRING
jgi:hypothetical protein